MPEGFDAWLDPALRLPVGGVDVRIPEPNCLDGLRLKAVYAALLAGEPHEPVDFADLLLADQRDALTERMTEAEVAHVARTAAAYYGAGRLLAAAVWESASGTIPDLTPDPDPEPQLVLGRWGWYDPAPGAYGPDDPGGGDWNPHSEYRAWYNDPALTPSAPGAESAVFTWPLLLANWDAVQCDLHARFGIDCGDRALLAARPISWLETRIRDLTHDPTTRTAALAADQE
jgi:hypothetical protein